MSRTSCRSSTPRCVILGLLATAMVTVTEAALVASTPVPAARPDALEKVDLHREDPIAAPSWDGRAIPATQPRTPAAVVALGGFTSVQVNVDWEGSNIVGDAANEPSIAIDPTNPDRIVIGFRQFDTLLSGIVQAGVAYSHDGGTTWTNIGPLDPGQHRSDPVLAADNNGTFFFASLSTGFSMEVFRSFDGGVSWSTPTPAYGGDKEWIAIDTTGGPGDGNIYAYWSPQFSSCPGNFIRSLDGGSSFTEPVWFPQPMMMAGTLDVGPDSELYVGGMSLYTGTPHVFARADRPYLPTEISFDLVKVVDLGGISTHSSLPNPAGFLGQVWLASDKSDQPTRSNIYMLGSVEPPTSDPMDVHFIRSVDGGQSWSAPARVNDDPPGTNAWQWFGTMSVAPNGRIDVVWNDTRNAADPPNATVSELHYSYSLDAGYTWSPNIALTPPFDSTVGLPSLSEKLGDYYHMISDNGGASLAYAATFNGEQDVYFLRIPADCNTNGVPDDQDVLIGGMTDCNGNLVPDTCEAANDCNGNSTQDICELAGNDCNHNLILDACEDASDCNANTIQDICDLFTGSSSDCNANHVPDECDIASGYSLDDDGTGIPDECEDACCTCDGCIQLTHADCLAQNGRYAGEGTSCATADCILWHDHCETAQVLPSDLALEVDFNSICATTDGPALSLAENLLQPMGSDLWYAYTAPCCGEVTVSLCNRTNFDAMMSVYGGGTSCECPQASDYALVSGDDTCGFASSPEVTLSVKENVCYLIRVGGWFDTPGAKGTGTLSLTMTCQSDDDGDGLCSSGDNCPDQTNPDQADVDHDGLGDACDDCPLDPDNDSDGDTICGDVDNCRTIANPDQADGDGDGVGDACEPAIVYVDANADGANTGLDWVDAFTDLQDALELAPTLASPVPPEIWVADGTYLPSLPRDADPRSVTFSIPPGVRVLGGFAGGETQLDQRDWSSNVAVLSGDLNGDDGEFPGNNTDNAYTVVLFATPGDPSEVDGFTITRGNTLPGFFFGGGVLFADGLTGGVLRNCFVTENVALDGGGVAINGSFTWGVPLIADCVIANNIGKWGGGLCNFGSAPHVVNTRFLNNAAMTSLPGGTGTGGNGGAVFTLTTNAGAVYSGCTFSGNSADVNGGAICAVSGAYPFLHVVNCTFGNNTAGTGGAIWNSAGSSLEPGFINIVNSIVYGNADNAGAGEASQLASNVGRVFHVNNSCIENLTGTHPGGGNIALDPRFVASDVDLPIEPGSPAVDAGQNLPYQAFELPWADFDGNPRFFDGDDDGLPTIDMGAYEVQELPLCVPTEAPLAEVGGVKKNRYISLVPGNAGERVALRVTLVALDGYAPFAGETRWIGPPQDYPEEDNSDPNRKFLGARLACAPHFADWGSIDLLHVFGGEVMPTSRYDVQAVHESCIDLLDDPDSYSLPLSLETGKWGDVTGLFEGDDPGAPQPDFNDISAVVTKFTGNPAAIIKACAQLQPNCALPDRAIDFKDIAAAVAAFVGVPYTSASGISGPCTCPSSVTCDEVPCTTDLQCAPGYCIGGFCTDACGRCTP